MSRHTSNGIRTVHEIACSANLALALADWLFVFGPLEVTNVLAKVDLTISGRLGLLAPVGTRAIDAPYPPGYFAFFVPNLAFTACLWLLLRLSARSHITLAFLRSGAGITAFGATPSMRLLIMWWSGTRIEYGWTLFRAIEFYELALIFVLGIVYSFGKWRIPDYVAVIVLLLHSVYWFWGFAPRFFFGWYAAPVGMCAGLAWLFYLRQLRRDPKIV